MSDPHEGQPQPQPGAAAGKDDAAAASPPRKIGSLRDRIAMFNQPKPSSAPPPVAKKPTAFKWKTSGDTAPNTHTLSQGEGQAQAGGVGGLEAAGAGGATAPAPASSRTSTGTSESTSHLTGAAPVRSSSGEVPSSSSPSPLLGGGAPLEPVSSAASVRSDTSSSTKPAFSAEDARQTSGSLKDRIALLSGLKVDQPGLPGRPPKPWKKKTAEVAEPEQDKKEEEQQQPKDAGAAAAAAVHAQRGTTVPDPDSSKSEEGDGNAVKPSTAAADAASPEDAASVSAAAPGGGSDMSPVDPQETEARGSSAGGTSVDEASSERTPRIPLSPQSPTDDLAASADSMRVSETADKAASPAATDDVAAPPSSTTTGVALPKMPTRARGPQRKPRGGAATATAASVPSSVTDLPANDDAVQGGAAQEDASSTNHPDAREAPAVTTGKESQEAPVVSGQPSLEDIGSPSAGPTQLPTRESIETSHSEAPGSPQVAASVRNLPIPPPTAAAAGKDEELEDEGHEEWEGQTEDTKKTDTTSASLTGNDEDELASDMSKATIADDEKKPTQIIEPVEVSAGGGLTSPASPTRAMPPIPPPIDTSVGSSMPGKTVSSPTAVGPASPLSPGATNRRSMARPPVPAGFQGSGSVPSSPAKAPTPLSPPPPPQAALASAAKTDEDGSDSEFANPAIDSADKMPVPPPVSKPFDTPISPVTSPNVPSAASFVPSPTRKPSTDLPVLPTPLSPPKRQPSISMRSSTTEDEETNISAAASGRSQTFEAGKAADQERDDQGKAPKQDEDVDEDEGEEYEDPEVARRQALAKRMAAMGGMKIGMLPTFGGAPIKRKKTLPREPSESAAGSDPVTSPEGTDPAIQAAKRVQSPTSPTEERATSPSARPSHLPPPGAFVLPGLGRPAAPQPAPSEDADRDVQAAPAEGTLSPTADEEEGDKTVTAIAEPTFEDVPTSPSRDPPPLPGGRPSRPPPPPMQSFIDDEDDEDGDNDGDPYEQQSKRESVGSSSHAGPPPGTESAVHAAPPTRAPPVPSTARPLSHPQISTTSQSQRAGVAEQEFRNDRQQVTQELEEYAGRDYSEGREEMEVEEEGDETGGPPPPLPPSRPSRPPPPLNTTNLDEAALRSQESRTDRAGIVPGSPAMSAGGYSQASIPSTPMSPAHRQPSRQSSVSHSQNSPTPSSISRRSSTKVPSGGPGLPSLTNDYLSYLATTSARTKSRDVDGPLASIINDIAYTYRADPAGFGVPIYMTLATGAKGVAPELEIHGKITTGAVFLAWDAKFDRGLGRSSLKVGSAEVPHIGIVAEDVKDMKKPKLKVVELLQGRHNVQDYKLDDLKSGKVEIRRLG